MPPFPASKKARGQAYGAGVSPVGFHSATRPQHIPAFLPPLPANQHATAATRPPKHGKKRSNENRRTKRIRQQQASQTGLAVLHGSGQGATAKEAATGPQEKKKRSKLRHQQITGRVSNSSENVDVVSGDPRLGPTQKGILDGTAKRN